MDKSSGMMQPVDKNGKAAQSDTDIALIFKDDGRVLIAGNQLSHENVKNTLWRMQNGQELPGDASLLERFNIVTALHSLLEDSRVVSLILEYAAGGDPAALSEAMTRPN